VESQSATDNEEDILNKAQKVRQTSIAMGYFDDQNEVAKMPTQ
jgi:hypothetical protein